MKISRYILPLALLGSLISCSKEGGDGTQTVDIKGAGSYILFSAGSPSRASNLVEDMSGKSFGVVGYKYPNSTNWDTFKATATPDPYFNNITVSCSADGVCTYTPVQTWENGRRYAFFAYYPATGLTVNSTSGAPSITYGIPSWSDVTALKDVMTSGVKDTDNSGDGTVQFHFYHRLFCLDVAARNYTSSAKVVSNVTVNIASDLYSSITVPLESQMLASAAVAAGSHTGATYSVLPSGSVSVPTGGALTQVSAEERNIILIPQNRPFNGSVSISVDGESKTINFGSATENQSFEPGIRYTLMFAFSADNLSLEIIKTSVWEDKGLDYPIIFE